MILARGATIYKMSDSKHAPKYEEIEKTRPDMLILNWLSAPRRWMRSTYAWMIGWAEKPQAEKALGGLSFIESFFFPIPPDPLLIAMVTARPKKWFRLATITTIGSVAGGIFGYLLGMLAIVAVMPVIISAGYEDAYHTAVAWFSQFGALAVILAAFAPVPYKIFTIAAGAAGMSMPLFIIGSIIGRGGRFYLVAFLMHHLGHRYKDKIEMYIDVLGVAFLALLVLGFVAVKYLA